MKTSDTLNLAADLIQQRGWTMGPQGWGRDGEDAPLCLEGALAAATGMHPRGVSSIEFHACPAYRAVVNHLKGRKTGNYVWDAQGNRNLYLFNDVHGRTAEQVIEVLRATAVIEAARENESAQVTA